LLRGIWELRIVHGKEKGVRRRTVHALLSRDTRVATFKLADGSRGSWGDTLVTAQSLRHPAEGTSVRSHLSGQRDHACRRHWNPPQ